MNSSVPPEPVEPSSAKRALRALRDMRARVEALEAEKNEPVAIVGMGCRFPGAPNLDGFWEMLREGRDGIREVPPERWDIHRYYHPDPNAPGKTVCRWGGYVDGLDRFDAAFFGISPREAPHIDPRQRLALETSWEALEDAGIPPDSLAGTKTGVFMATLTNDYDQLITADPSRITSNTSAGVANSVVANRISYFLDLHGPSLTVDTACSGSLLAVHLACRSLRTGESSLALAGGASVNLLPTADICFSRMGALSPDGRCRTFDRRANGMVRSEGAGIVVLKPLSRAIQDGDRIYAVIRGSATNHDGRSNGIMSPNGKAQESLLREAYAQAGIRPGRVQYVEAHGTGTSLGDQIEVHALSEVLSDERPFGRPCVVGSVKTNIGHAEAAAGAAGLIKTALALKHRVIPPNLHFEEINPALLEAAFPLEVRRTPGPFPVADEPPVAGVSSFSVGGANVHIVLESWTNNQPAEPVERPGAFLLPLSARSPAALRATAESHRDLLASASVEDVCYTASIRRAHHDHRLTIAAASRAELLGGLDAFLRDEELPPAVSNRIASRDEDVRLVFVFSGQGSQWLGMGSDLYAREPAFQRAIDECEPLFRKHAGWSLVEQLHADADRARMAEINVAQPLILAVQVALAALWRSWGVEPDLVCGQSLGEISAAHVAGALTLEDAVLIICERSRLLRTHSGTGANAVVGLPAAEAEAAMAPFARLLGVAGSTSPTSCLVAGEPAALEEFLQSLEARDVFVRRLDNVDVAAHSPKMDELRPELVRRLQGIRPGRTSIPFFSTVTAAPAEGESLDAAYWGRNLRQPFRVADSVARLIESGSNAFLEISPHPVLTGAIQQSFRHANRDGAALGSLRREENGQVAMLSSLGALHTRGYPVRWHLLGRPGRLVPLPHYPWQRERYWLNQIPSAGAAADARKPGGHPLLGARLETASAAGNFWENEWNAFSMSWLNDHAIEGVAALPAAAFLEMALAAVDQVFPGAPLAVEEASFDRLLLLPSDESRRVQTALTPEGAISIHSFDNSWTRHSTARMAHDSGAAPQAVALDDLAARCPEAVPVEEFYRSMHARGLQYGPAFQAVRSIRRGHREAVSEIQLSAGLESEAAAYRLHPVLLDAVFQSVAAIFPAGKHVYLPQSVAKLSVHRPVPARVWSHVRLDAGAQPGAEILEADVRLFDDSGLGVAEVAGLRLRRLDEMRPQPKWSLGDSLYEPAWVPKPRREPLEERGRTGRWLILADSTGAGQSLAAALEARGEQCVVVDHRSGLAGVSQSAARGVVYFGALNVADAATDAAADAATDAAADAATDAAADAATDAAADAETDTAADDAHVCDGPLHLAQSLIAASERHSPPVWFITRGAPTSAAQAPIWGFGKVLALEQPEIFGGLIDLDPAGDPDEASRILAEILEPDEDRLVAFRQGERHVARLQRMPVANAAARPLAFRTDGSYLITGGLIGLGLETARWMVRRGARHLVLLGRSELPPRAEWTGLDPATPAGVRVAAIRELESMGASVHSAAVDVADEAQLSAFLDRYRRECHPPLRGVIHSAGVVQDKLLMRMQPEDLAAVMRPKLQAGRLLDRLTAGDPLDFFVLYSSASSIMGQFGQANYAAANAFLDALAHQRRAQGRPALSINWGPWAEAGLFARLNMAARAGLEGVESLTPEQGLGALAHLLERGATQAMVLNADWSRIPGTPFLSELRRVEQPAAAAQAGPDTDTVLLDLLLAGPAERKARLESWLRETAAKVLRSEPSRLNPRKPLTALGMDSIMAVELRNRITRTLRLNVTLVELFTGSVARLVDKLELQLKTDERLIQMVDEVARLSTEDVKTMLVEGHR